MKAIGLDHHDRRPEEAGLRQARTPYQRLLAAGALDDHTRARLEAEHATLNPAKITRRINAIQQQLIQLAAARTQGGRPAA